MAVNYAYNYAWVPDLSTGLCLDVRTTTLESTDPSFIPIPVYDPEYLLKYYINGNWYEDAAGTIPWTSSLL